MDKLDDSNASQEEKEHWAAQLLDLLEEYPRYSYDCYRANTPYRFYTTPLHRLLAAKIGPPGIKKFLAIVPDGIEPLRLLDSSGQIPFEVACRCASDEVINLVASLDPTLLVSLLLEAGEGKESGGPPFSFSVSTANLLIDAAPTGITHFVFPKLLHQEEFPTQSLEYILEKWPRDRPVVIGGGRLSVDRYNVLLHLLPKITKLQLGTGFWEMDDFFNAMAQNHSIDSLILEATDKYSVTADSWQMFRSKRTLRSIEVTSRMSSIMREQQQLLDIVDGLGDAEPRISVTYTGRNFSYWSTNLIQVLDSTNSNATGELQTLLRHLQLTNLEFSQSISGPSNARIDLTSTLLDYLNHTASSNLRMLSLFMPNICDVLPILEALKTNEHLEEVIFSDGGGKEIIAAVPAAIQLLQEYNTTLRRFEPFVYKNAKIRYLLDLNRFGRATARNGTIEDFIECLVEVLELADRRDLYSLTPFDITSILFGLLLERPALWSASVNSERRP